VLPDELEKHCIQAEPILDKNASASKRLASAHLLLWICRRFSTDEAVRQAIWRLPGGPVVVEPACFAYEPAVSCRQEAVALPCAGLGVSTFFLKTKKRSRSVGSTSTTFAFAFAFALVAGVPVFPRAAASLY
jgi:hypothetical protein